MDRILELLTTSNSPLLIITIALVFLLVFFKEYFKVFVRIRELQLSNKGNEKLPTNVNLEGNVGPIGAEGDVNKSPNKDRFALSYILGDNFKILERYYEQSLNEYKLILRASLLIAILGFIVIIIGVSLVMADKVSIGIVSGIGGILAEASAVLFFRQNKVMADQITEYHKKLVCSQYLQIGITLAEQMPCESACAERHRIITNLLFLSNELHGSKSDHLFNE